MRRSRGDRIRPVCLAAGVLAVGLVGASYQSASAVESPSSDGPYIVFHIDVPQIDESSSLIYSTAHTGLVYTANDSGDGPYVYVLDDNGNLVGTTTLAGVHAVDVEAMARGPGGSLIVGDIGDNRARRSSIQLYKIPQPVSGDHTVTPQKVTLTYADGPRDAESLLYDPSTRGVLVVSKELLGSVYASPADVFSLSSAQLTSVAAAPSYATDATWIDDQKEVVIRTYRWGVEFSYPSWQHLLNFRLPHQPQGESITSVPGHRVWVGSEGKDSAVWSVPLPQGRRGDPSGGGAAQGRRPVTGEAASARPARPRRATCPRWRRAREKAPAPWRGSVEAPRWWWSRRGSRCCLDGVGRHASRGHRSARAAPRPRT